MAYDCQITSQICAIFCIVQLTDGPLSIPIYFIRWLTSKHYLSSAYYTNVKVKWQVRRHLSRESSIWFSILVKGLKSTIVFILGFSVVLYCYFRYPFRLFDYVIHNLYFKSTSNSLNKYSSTNFKAITLKFIVRSQSHRAMLPQLLSSYSIFCFQTSWNI